MCVHLGQEGDERCSPGGCSGRRFYSCSQVSPDTKRCSIGRGREAPPPASSHVQTPTDISGPATFSVFRSSTQPNSCSSTWSSQRSILHLGPRFNNQMLLSLAPFKMSFPLKLNGPLSYMLATDLSYLISVFPLGFSSTPVFSKLTIALWRTSHKGLV